MTEEAKIRAKERGKERAEAAQTSSQGLASSARARLCDGCDGCDARSCEGHDGGCDGCDGRDGDSDPSPQEGRRGGIIARPRAATGGHSAPSRPSQPSRGRPVMRRTKPTSGSIGFAFACHASSTGCGLAAPKIRPVVCRGLRRGNRRPVVTIVVTRARPEPPFGAAPRLVRNARRRARKRRIIVRCIVACFRIHF